MREKKRIAVKLCSGCVSAKADLSQKESILIQISRVEGRYVKRKCVVNKRLESYIPLPRLDVAGL